MGGFLGKKQFSGPHLSENDYCPMKVYPPCREDQLRDLLLSQYSYASIPYKQKMQGASAGDLKYSTSIGATSETPVIELIHPSFKSLNRHDFFKK